VDENVFAAVIAHDKAETLLRVEELYNALAFADDLRGHPTAAAKTAAAAAAEATAATAATEAVTAAAKAVTAANAAATAEAIAAATTAAEAAVKSAAKVVTEIVALVPAASTTFAAPPFIETHALFVFPVRPIQQSKNPSFGRRTQVFRRQNHCATKQAISQKRRGGE